MRLRLDEGAARDKIFVRLAATNALATGAASSPQRLRETFAMDFLVQHQAEPVGLADAARACSLSPSRLARLFRAHAGLTPQQFLEGQRLHRARRLLELTARPLGAIAAEVGYGNPFYFTLRFKRATALSPRDYRKKHGGGA